MEAAAVSDVVHGPGPAGGCTSGRDDVLEAQLTLLELQRTGLFDEVDRQLSNLTDATVPADDLQPRAAAPKPALAIVAAPSLVPEITVAFRRDAETSREPRAGQGLRAALVAGALLAAFGLGWIGAASIVRLFDTPVELTGKAAIDAVVERIISAESSNAADVKNKRSSAAGLGQFLDDTWLDMIRLYRPDLAKAHNRDETLDLRREATIAREMTTRFAERNAALLKRRGLPVTASTIYLAHFAGGAGAVALLTAPADADAAFIMANADATGRTKREQIVKANPFLERLTVADLKLWAERKMRGPGLSLSELLSADAKK